MIDWLSKQNRFFFNPKIPPEIKEELIKGFFLVTWTHYLKEEARDQHRL